MTYVLIGASCGLLFNLVYISILLTIQNTGGHVNWALYMWSLPFDVMRLHRQLRARNNGVLFWTLTIALLLCFVGMTICIPLAVRELG